MLIVLPEDEHDEDEDDEHDVGERLFFTGEKSVSSFSSSWLAFLYSKNDSKFSDSCG